MQLDRENIKTECLKSWIRNNIAAGALEVDLDEDLDD
jgi:hypothetical protein